MPVNACGASPCSAYAGASCDPTGACLVVAPLSGVVMVIELASDSYFAPGRTFVVPHDQLAGTDTASMKCTLPPCGRLPPDGVVQGNYVMSACVQSATCGGLDWNLGNDAPGPTATGLPVVATYRMLQDQWNDDVVSLGLPIEPVQAQAYENSAAEPGPEGGPGFAFQTYLQPGTYERTLVPDSPYDSIFAPEVTTLEVLPGTAPFEHDTVTSSFDVTQLTGKGPTLPTFDIARADGLDGWSAYLRDATTLETISNVRPLSGTLAQGVLLVTNHLLVNHVRTRKDALTNAELVVEPPTGLSIPRGVFGNGAPELPAQETYPGLPPPVSFGGNVVSADGSPLAADLVFDAVAITDQNGKPNVANFEFVGYASARPSTPDGASTYSVKLPPGQYGVAIRPVDLSSAVTVENLLVDGALSLSPKTFSADAMRTVEGSAFVADERPLSGATIEALPTTCAAPVPIADADAGAPAAPATPTASCLPRPGQATVGGRGAFTLSLDPGGYLLRVRPADGTRLPWVTKNLTVQAASTAAPQQVAFTIPRLTIPAPASAGLQLFDPTGANPIVNAVVRAFAVPAQIPLGTSPTAPAIELGRALTDADGKFDLYLTLPTE